MQSTGDFSSREVVVLGTVASASFHDTFVTFYRMYKVM